MNSSNSNTNSNNKVKSDSSSIISSLPKPDFSTIEKQENSVSFHLNGSYKKKKSYVPDSPVKKNTKYLHFIL